MEIPETLDAERWWLHPEEADADGLVGYGGELKPGTLLLAYSEGVFPWFSHNEPVLWWSPDPRGIFELDTFHIPRRLARTLKKNEFKITINQCFETVMRNCGDNRPEGTWITESMVRAYTNLNRLGFAHSIEVWKGGELVGGLYGLALGAFFAAESMFHRVSDASKIALIHLVERLRTRGYSLLDTQMLTPHTRSLGAVEIPREHYLIRLQYAVANQGVSFAGETS